MKAFIYHIIAPLLFILFYSFCSANAYNYDFACSKAWGTDRTSYRQCKKMFKRNPKTAKADKPGIIAIAAKAAIKQMHVNIYKYEHSEHKGEAEYQEALDVCIRGYQLAEVKMEEVDGAYEQAGLNMATIYSSAAMDTVASCIDAFTWRKLDHKMEKENTRAMHLIHQVSKFIQL